MNLGNLLDVTATKSPRQAAVIFQDESISYDQLERSTTSLARWFLAQGCRPGDRIALHWSNSIEMVKLLFACFKAGLIAVPINVSMKLPEITYILTHSKAVMCFAHPDQLRTTDEAARDCAWVRGIHTTLEGLGEGTLGALPNVKENDPALILYTSGTTARPKGVTHTHRTLLEIVRLCCDMVSDGLETVLLMTQMTYITAICATLLPAIAAGATTVVVAAFDAPLVLDLIERFHCTYAFALPSMAQGMVEEQATRPRNVASLRIFLVAGDSVSTNTQERFQTLFGIPLREAYGMTEIGPAIANSAAGARSGSLGKVVAGVEVSLVDAAGRAVPDDQCGEIIVRSPGSFIGYWDNPAATAEAVRNGWLYTGDLAHRDAAGYIWFDGRKKEIIVRGGYNISPQEVEEALYGHPAVLEVAVIGTPVPVQGESVVAFVTLGAGFASDEQELKAHAATRLTDIKVPEKIVFLQNLPKGVTGKIQRQALKELAASAVA